MSEVFISYSRRDAEVVDKIVQILHDSGADAWIDREDIRAGNSWRLQIVEAIDECAVFVLALSPNSAVSENVRKEIDLAQDSNRVIIPIVLEEVKIPAAIRYQLAGLQFIDIPMLGLEQALKQLVEVVKDEIAKKKAVPKPKTKTTELVIQGVDLSAFDEAKQKHLLEFIASLTDANQSQLKISNLVAGSVHAFVQMPVRAACQLKTFTLNRDARFKKMNITSLRVGGDTNFINTALGTFIRPARSSKPMWMGTAIVILAAIAGLIFWMRPSPAPQAESPTETFTPATTATWTPTQTFTPTSTLTFTPTFTPSATATFVPINRCPIFEDRLLRVTFLKWYPGTPLVFYFKFPGGVPGLEDKTEDGTPWTYSFQAAQKFEGTCEFVEGYKERLYCSMNLPSVYAHTLIPMSLTVNGCETPIYQNPVAEIPDMEVVQTPRAASGNNSSGSAPSCGSPPLGSSIDGWCTCMGGTMSPLGSCIVP